MLSDIRGAKQSDDGPVEEYRLRPGDIAFRPRNRKLWSDLSGGRFVQILQSRETYDNLLPELVRGGAVHFEPQDAFSDPLISQIAATIADRDRRWVRRRHPRRCAEHGTRGASHAAFFDQSALMLEPSNGLSRDRLKRVRDYIEAHLDDRFATLADLAGRGLSQPLSLQSILQASARGRSTALRDAAPTGAGKNLNAQNQTSPSRKSLTGSGSPTRAI